MKTFRKCLAFLLAVFIIAGNMPFDFLPGFRADSKGIFELRASAYAQENGYEYYVLGDNTARIFSLTQYFSGNVIIPPTLGGYTVTQIGQSVFENKKDVTGITVPAGVKLIDDNAFRGCDGLLSVSFPANLQTIGNNVFMDCINLTSVSIPNTVLSIGSSVFFNCTALQMASVGTGVTTLPSLSFSQCSALVSVSLPPALQIIGYGAFMDDLNLTTIVIPSSVTEIQQYAFRGCVKLANFTFNPPASIQKLGSGVFYACHALTQIALPPTLTNFDEGVFNSCINLTSITIPYGTTAIPLNMFNSCGKLAYVYLPNTVTSIGENAFIWCTSLPSINLPGGLKSIGDSAFYHCTALKSISLPEGLQTIDYQAFAASGLEFVTLPSTMASLPNKAFYECYDLLSVTFPNSVVNFGTDVFKSCFDLTIYCNPGSIAEQFAVAKSIPYVYIASYTVQFNANGGSPGMTVTQNCGMALTAPVVTRTGYSFAEWLPAVPPVMPAANTTYTAQWTVNQYKVEYHIGSAVTTYWLNYGGNMIPPMVFFQPDDLTVFTGWSPEVPASVPAQDTVYTAQFAPAYTYTVSGGKATITAASNLITGFVNIPAQLDGYPVTSIGYHAFQNCADITGIIIPSSVTSIDARAFMGCSGLSAVTIPAGVTSIGNQAFQDCTALASITVPASLAGIGSSAFANTAWMNAKPDGPVTIGNVFYRYKGIMPAGTTVTFSTGTLGIAGGAFSGCPGLVAVDLPETLTTIGVSAFNGCAGLTRIVIPQSVTAIGALAFNNCTAMEYCCYPDSYAHEYANTNDIAHTLVVRITFDANGGTGGTSTAMAIGAAMTAPTVTRPSFVFNGWSPALPATVPESNTTYTAQWTTVFSYTIKESIATVTGTNMTITGAQEIPATLGGYPVRIIGEAAFRNMTGITSMTIPDGVQTIGGGAFDGCTGLTAVTIPASVQEIGTNAFRGCPNLMIYCYPDSYAIEYAETNHLPYKVHVTVVFSLNGGTGTVPAILNGLSGDAVVLPAQGDISKPGCHFLGWAKSASALTPLASYAMETRNRTLYAVWSVIPQLGARAGSTAVFDTQNGYIYGLATGLTKTAFENTFVSITGNGRLEYAPDTGSIGTGTTVSVIDNMTGLAVQTFTVIIFGDLNGDGSVDSIDAGKAVDFENYMVPWDPADDTLYIKAGDLNGDGSVDSLDAGKIVDAENYMISINQVTGLA